MPTPPRPKRKSIRPAIVGLVLAPTVFVGTFLLVTRDDGAEQVAQTGATEPGVAHVHGLGIDPADGLLRVATHYGTYVIPDDGPAERVGASYQDTMGFTIAGPDRFYGSGHPDVAGIRRGEPGLLGLIESTDSGVTWESVSLSGEVDFHGLATAHDQVYGWDSTSGRFLVSPDGETWDTRSTLDLFSFAVDPSDADHVVGASPDGVLDSTDGGRTWQAVDAPDLVVLSWHETSGLWGVTPGGTTYDGGDDGTDWRETGSLPGAPQALLAADDVLYAAAEEDEVTGIYRSEDDGRTWQLRYRDGG